MLLNFVRVAKTQTMVEGRKSMNDHSIREGAENTYPVQFGKNANHAIRSPAGSI